MFQKHFELKQEEKIHELLKEGLKLPISSLKTKSVNELISTFDELKKDIDNFLLIHPEQEKKFLKSVNTRYIYETTSIDGNSLSYSDVNDIINDDKVCKNATMREHLEIINQTEALKYINAIIKFEGDMNSVKLKSIHKNIFRSIGTKNTKIYRDKPISGVYSKHTAIEPDDILEEMRGYFDFYDTNKNQGIHPLIFSSIVHEKLSIIHPFIPGNSSVARLFMNYVLMKNNYYIITIGNKVENKIEYYNALENINSKRRNDIFLKFIAIEGIYSYLYHISVLINLTKSFSGSFKEKIEGTTLEHKILKMLR